MATVYSYARFSSKPQELGGSIKRQKGLGDAWLSRHPEHTLDQSLRLRDLGISAFRGANLDKDKGDLGKFIHLAMQGKIQRGSILMLENLDRFSRQPPRKAYRIFCDLVETGVKVLTLVPEAMIDESNVDNLEVVLPVIIQMQLSYQESKRKSHWNCSDWDARRAEAAATGKPMSRRCPAWLVLRDGKFEVVEHKAEIVRRIFRMAIDGMGVIAIASRLNREKVELIAERSEKAIKMYGPPVWNRAYIQDILQNEAVIGRYQPYMKRSAKRQPIGEPINGYYPQIVDEATFYKARDTIAHRRVCKGRTGQWIPNLFTGLVKDYKDGCNYTLTDKGKNGKSDMRLVRASALQGLSEYTSFS